MRTSVLWLPQSPETAGARTHRPDSAFVTLLWNAAGLLPCKRASTGPCKPLCVHCKDLGCRRRGWKKKDAERTEPGPNTGPCRSTSWVSPLWRERVVLCSIHYNPPFKHWESLQFYLNLFHKEQIQFESSFPALGREEESLLLPGGTIKYLCSVSCSFQGPHACVTSESGH